MVLNNRLRNCVGDIFVINMKTTTRFPHTRLWIVGDDKVVNFYSSYKDGLIPKTVFVWLVIWARGSSQRLLTASEVLQVCRCFNFPFGSRLWVAINRYLMLIAIISSFLFILGWVDCAIQELIKYLFLGFCWDWVMTQIILSYL